MPAPKVAPKVAPKPHRAPEPAPVDTKDRKPSLKEMPSYLKEVSVALTRYSSSICYIDLPIQYLMKVPFFSTCKWDSFVNIEFD